MRRTAQQYMDPNPNPNPNPNPDQVRRTAQQYMDEYYALDFEDVIGQG